jgi:hypothetical protein
MKGSYELAYDLAGSLIHAGIGLFRGRRCLRQQSASRQCEKQ